MIRRPPRSKRTDTLFPYTTLVRSAALHQPLHAAPARTSVRIAPLPWREGESAWRIGRLILDPLELGADPVAKRFEPGAWALLLFDQFNHSKIPSSASMLRQARFRPPRRHSATRSEEHTSELQSLMRTSDAAFSLTKQNKATNGQSRI